MVEYVPCRESKGGSRVRWGGEVRAGRASRVVRAWGSVAAQAGMHGEGPTQGLGARARAERTPNIMYIRVTLEKSRLRGWLNFCAFCHSRREEHAMWGEVQGREAREGVGRRRRMRGCTGKARPTRLEGQGTRGAHAEHVARVPDLGGVKAQRLVESCRALPSRKEGMRYGARCEAGRRAGVGRRPAQVGMYTGKRPDLRLGGQGTRGAHVKHALHAQDLGCVPAERLVERVRGLPSRGEGMYKYGTRCGPGGGRAWGIVEAQAGVHGEGLTQGLGARARAERTWNMELISVTLEVSQLSG
jgi:hypothetical protein